ncbi:MAG: hypothetical protein EXS35_16915 [Pedosphaera sp.]|nr:hypothetical protein [Pedosphaera sp.]
MNPTIEELTERYLRGELTEAELTALEQRLSANDAERAQFRRAARLEANLRAHATEQQSEVAAWSAPRPVVEATLAESLRALLWRWRAPFATAAAVLVGLLLTAVFVSKRNTEAWATVVRVADAEFADVGLRANGTLREQEVTLTKGTVEFVTARGVKVVIDAPTEFRFESAQRLRLVRGFLNADAGAKGKGFTVATSAGEVVDLGTRFGVGVERDGEAQVAVFSGQVRVEPAGGRALTGGSVTLDEGGAVRLRRDKQTERLQSIRLRPVEDGLAGLGQPSVVADIADNVTNPKINSFYGLVPQGMGDGAAAYTIRSDIGWHAPDGVPFPAELTGADLIRTMHRVRHDTRFLLRFRVTQPAVVYVMMDERAEPPAWLERGFTRTGWRVASGPWRPGGRVVGELKPATRAPVFIPCAVWKMELPQGGAVELGPPREAGDRGQTAMYGVAVKPANQR